VEDWRPAVGVLESLSEPKVAAEVSARVTEVLAREGDLVRKDQVLARLDDTDYRLAVEQAQAALARAKAQVHAYDLKIARLRPLVRSKTAPRSMLEDARAARDGAQAQLEAARAQLKQTRRQLEKTIVRSPLNGRVLRKLISAGDFARAGAPLFALVTSDRLKARLPYSETLADRLRPGLPVRLRIPAAPGQIVTARITRISPAVDALSRAVHVIAELDNRHGWLPGASVTGEVRIARRENSVVVPAVSVVLRPRGEVVYVLDGGKAKERPVRTGLRLDGVTEILEGLKAGETVIADGAGFLHDGMKVKVKAQ
jgi:RND family efflux transporter MFP subunit